MRDDEPRTIINVWLPQDLTPEEVERYVGFSCAAAIPPIEWWAEEEEYQKQVQEYLEKEQACHQTVAKLGRP